MTRLSARWVVVAIAVTGATLVHTAAPRQGSLPPQASLERLTDAEFWSLVTDASEPDGAFHSDNFTSNEPDFAEVVAALERSGPHGGAYLGVGPEQNFHYMAAIKPAIAVIFDIRRQAVMQHLLYKAVFELSADRAAFIARLFSVAVPDGVDRQAPVAALWRHFAMGPGTDRARLAANVAAVESLLTGQHGFALTAEDLASLEYVYRTFFELGPEITYAGFTPGLSTGNMNFVKLASAVDATGVARSVLGSDDRYQFVKSLQTRNLVVPIQADFGGPKAIRFVADFMRARGVRVSAFYISNVEQYLFHPELPVAPGGREINGGWRAFYDNLAALPADASTVLLRTPYAMTSSVRTTRTMPDGTVQAQLRSTVQFCPLSRFVAAVKSGKITTQTEATACGR